mgnify:CR=1 FL=1
MRDFMTTKEASQKWSITVRQVQNLCKAGRIPGVEKIGKNYLIPHDAIRPIYGFQYGNLDNKNNRQ